MALTELRVGSLLVEKESRLLVEVVELRPKGAVIEYDDDGSQHERELESLQTDFELYREGAQVRDRTGKGRFENPGHPNYRAKK